MELLSLSVMLKDSLQYSPGHNIFCDDGKPFGDPERFGTDAAEFYSKSSCILCLWTWLSDGALVCMLMLFFMLCHGCARVRLPCTTTFLYTAASGAMNFMVVSFNGARRLLPRLTLLPQKFRIDAAWTKMAHNRTTVSGCSKHP
ncbi:uncharacterized protein HD556DRAFT_1407507 [Suillus plorans]|uniref:Uncharacterized protein n=1 Tax=Suillus plorans TaxID=116603 RepID=A0A9P7AEK0_9AGAM|nr:uncharacterized protein HD556DRAFT_1407507 [Suillus plorans]KAG1787749.1 hypothetical protein HD556DRAFT_1407507 [Suillus plorans]